MSSLPTSAFEHATGTTTFSEEQEEPFMIPVESAASGAFSNYVPSSRFTTLVAVNRFIVVSARGRLES